jgi:hypothetical protein
MTYLNIAITLVCVVAIAFPLTVVFCMVFCPKKEGENE